jgi:hypothetical protein
MDAPRALAAGGDDLVTRPDLLAEGWSDSEIAAIVRSGWLHPLQAGVYGLGARPPSWARQVRAALLAAGPDAVASHRAALVLWGLDGIKAAPVEITVGYTCGPTPQGVIVHRTRRPAPASVIDGIRVTGVERTLQDAGTVVPPVVVEKAFCSAWRRNLTSPAKAELYLEHHGGRGCRGTARFREVVALYKDGGRAPGSDGEVVFLRTLREHGVEPPVRQFPVRLRDGSIVSVDFAWPDRRKLVEFVGLDVHADSRAHDDDTWRENAIRDAGWDLRRFAPHSLRVRPAAVAAAVLRFL